MPARKGKSMSSLTVNGYTLTHAAIHATQGISPIERLVLATLSSFANFIGTCWPSNQTLADRTGLHERTVRRQLESLQAKGLIERHSRGQGRAMLTRILITPKGKTSDIVPTTSDIVPPITYLLNLNTNTAATAAPVVVQEQIPEQPEQPAPAPDHVQSIAEMPDYEAQLAFTHSQYAPVEADKTPAEATLAEVPANPTTYTPAPVVAEGTNADQAEGTGTDQATQYQAVDAIDTTQADPAMAEWAKVDPLVLLSIMEIRKAKRKAPKPNPVEIKHWYSVAMAAGWSLPQIAYAMCLRNWSRIDDASWLTGMMPPQMTATGAPAAPAAPKVWQPEPYQPASKDFVARMKAEISAMKQRWKAESVNAPPMRH